MSTTTVSHRCADGHVRWSGSTATGPCLACGQPMVAIARNEPPKAPLSPAPAEPAKAAGWTPKVGDRVVMAGTVSRQLGGDRVDVLLDAGITVMLHEANVRPEAAPPAAAPVTLTVPDGAIVLPDDRYLRMQLADASSKRDQYEALSVKRELELGDKERENARLRSALRDATAKLQRRGGI